jgi:glycerol kinase
MAKYVLALDQGTTSSRAILFNHDGAIVSVAQQEFPQIYPAPGLVEHDPEAIWSSQLTVAREAIRQAGASPADIAAIGITNQRETAIVWEKATGKPVFNAIVWQSRLTVPICAGLASAVRPHDPDRVPGPHREGEVLRDDDAAEPLRHVV